MENTTKLNVQNADWFIKPAMMGHYYAIKNVNKFLEIRKSFKKQSDKKIFSNLFELSSESWHYWNMLSDAYFAAAKSVTKRQAKKTPWSAILIWFHHSSYSRLLKTRIDHFLESMTYQYDYENGLNYYVANISFYGLNRKEAKQRYDEYGKKISGKF